MDDSRIGLVPFFVVSARYSGFHPGGQLRLDRSSSRGRSTPPYGSLGEVFSRLPVLFFPFSVARGFDAGFLGGEEASNG